MIAPLAQPSASATSDARLAVAAFADTAAFSVTASSTMAIPLIFSVALPDVFALPKTVLAIALAALLVVLLIVRWLAAGPPARRLSSMLATSILVFVVWILLAAWFAVDRAHALFGERLQYQGLATTVAYVVFFFAAWVTVRGTRRQTIFLLSVVAGAVVVAGYALVQRAGLDPIWPTLPHDRVFSTIGQPNALAAYLVMVSPLILALAAGRRWPLKLAQAGLIGLVLIALAFTLSRGGYVGVGVAALVLIAAAWPRARRLLTARRIGTAAVIGLIALSAVLAIPDARAGAQRVVARAMMTPDLSEGSTRFKLDLWNVALAIVADHPFLGTGPDSYVLVFGQYRDRVLTPDRVAVVGLYRPESPHNTYLATAVGAGLPGLGAYLAVVAAVITGLLPAVLAAPSPRAYLFGAALLAAIAGHLVTDTFQTAETSGSILFWILLGVGAAFSDHRERNSPP